LRFVLGLSLLGPLVCAGQSPPPSLDTRRKALADPLAEQGKPVSSSRMRSQFLAVAEELNLDRAAGSSSFAPAIVKCRTRAYSTAPNIFSGSWSAND
jgi:hypothetical protein